MGDLFMKWMRDNLYSPFLTFSLKNRFLVISLFISLFILTIGSFGGGIIRTSFFPQLASDRVSIDLIMPNGTNERITDSIINYIEGKSKIVNEEFTKKYLNGTGEKLFVNTVKTLGNGSSKANLIISDSLKQKIINYYRKDFDLLGYTTDFQKYQ